METGKNDERFLQQLRELGPSGIIMAMVNGLKSRHVKVDMNTYGQTDKSGVCFGCAATNTICELTGIVFSEENIGDFDRSEYLNISLDLLSDFEEMIDDLRRGNTITFNYFAERYNIPTISTEIKKYLPYLNTYYKDEELLPYEEFANKLRSQAPLTA